MSRKWHQRFNIRGHAKFTIWSFLKEISAIIRTHRLNEEKYANVGATAFISRGKTANESISAPVNFSVLAAKRTEAPLSQAPSDVLPCYQLHKIKFIDAETFTETN